MPGSTVGACLDPDAPLPWHRWVQELSLAYHWAPQQIAEMSMAQVLIYLACTPGSDGRQRMSVADGLVLQDQRRDERQRWIEQMRGRCSDGGDWG